MEGGKYNTILIAHCHKPNNTSSRTGQHNCKTAYTA